MEIFEISEMAGILPKKTQKNAIFVTPARLIPRKTPNFCKFLQFPKLQKNARLQITRNSVISLFLWSKKTPIFALFFVAAIFLKKHAESTPGNAKSLQKHDQNFCKKKCRFCTFFEELER